MEALRKEVVASVELVDVKASEDELAVIEAALTYLLLTHRDGLSQKLGAEPDEVEGIRDDLRRILGSKKESEPTMEFAEKS